MRSTFTFFIFVLFNLSSIAQNIDSVQNIIDHASSDSVKISHYINDILRPLTDAGDEKRFSDYYQKALKHVANNKELEIRLKNQYASFLISQEKYNEASDLLNHLMVAAIEIKSSSCQGLCLRNKAILHLNKGDYNKAAELYYAALEKWKETGNLLKVAMGYGDLAVINYYSDHFDMAAAYWEKSVDIYTIKESKKDLASDLGNLGLAYIEIKNFYKAEQTLKKAITICTELQKPKMLASAYTNFCKLEYMKGKIDKALEYNNKAIEIYKQLNDVGQLSRTFSNGAEIARKAKNFPEALIYINKAFEYENKRDVKSNMKDIYLNRAALLYDLGRTREAYDDLQFFMFINDSLRNSDNQKAVTELEKKYELSEKEKENQLLNQKIEIQNVESSRQQLIIALIGLILIVVAVIVFVLYKQNRTKQRINSQLEEKNHIIEEQHKDITDSIQYSKRIQEAIMPTMNLWEETLPNSFVLYKPKDVLSGDFYWMEKTKDTIYFAACDCTGHGVPGAMVSVICSTALNRAVKEFGLKETGIILDKVRELVLETFEKSEGNVQDGMDISVCALNTKTLELKWSGANNPLWYLEKGEAKEITATKQPIGQVDNPVPFKTHSLQLNKNDIIYVFTDGYADQFGGPKGKKFKYKQLKELLVTNAGKSMKEQHDILLKAFENWKGNLEQVDDVCVIGVRV